MTDPIERQFAVNGLTLAAKEWGSGKNCRVLALHGWLDNCASFDVLARQLEVNTVAPDLAGHGLSSHRSADSAYNIWQDVDELIQIADAMGWSRFAVLGHSRGAMIATLLAAVVPDRVTRLGLVEGLVPIPLPPEDAPAQLARAIRDRHKYQGRDRRYYASIEDAAEQRTRGDFPLTAEGAMCLAVRGTRRDENGYCWSADPRLQGASEVKFSVDQLRAFLQNVQAPVQLFLSERSLEATERIFGSLWTAVKHGQLQVLPGSHHLHMEAASVRMAEQLNHFLLNT